MDKVINKYPGSENDSRKIPFQCIDAIQISLLIEKEGLGFYEKAANNVSDSRVREMFLRLAQEEKEHIQNLQSKIQFLQPAIASKSKVSRGLDSFMIKELKGKVFPASETKKTQKYESDLEALDYGIESEKRSINILRQLLQNEQKLDVKAVFSHLIAEEKKHLALLEGLREKFDSK